MKATLILHIVLYLFLMPVVLHAETKDGEKARVIVTTDSDADVLDFRWSVYAGPGTYDGNVQLVGEESPVCSVIIPRDASGRSIHLILELRDEGGPSLASYRRIVINVK